MGEAKSDWRCIRVLGRGSFGVVELWKNNRTQKFNAVKRFEIRSSGDGGLGHVSDKLLEEYKKLWRKEVELMSNIKNCPYIVSAERMPQDLVIPHSMPPTLFMEYCSGGNLRSVLKLPENICGLRQQDALSVLDHVSKAITFLHSMDIVHRDLKPDNILRCYDSNNKVTYKLSDLGFAKDVSQSHNKCTTFLGTPQYLAPEIYTGKPYDKTVDYWSFGIIAFEIMCGVRPFLHGESPSNWLPLVEKKAKDAICIYRTSDGKILFSNTIPFYTHFSEVMKECMVTWLRTMLQLNPTHRGRTIEIESHQNLSLGAETEVVNLKLLSCALSTKFLEIQGVKERMEFPVGNSGHSKIEDIQQRISLKTGLIPDNQLLLTVDGAEVQKTEVASKFLQMDLYLLPRCADLLRLKVKFPKTVHSFITEWDTLKDPTKLRKVWACAIYYLQAELRKIDILKKSNDALKAWCNTTFTAELQGLRIAIEKAGSSLGTILELESQLEGIDEKYSKNGQSSSHAQQNGDSGKAGSRYWTEEMSKLHNYYTNCFDSWVENLVLKLIRTTELEELYYKILKACGDWKTSDSNSPPFSYNEVLVRSVCQFIVAKNELDDALFHNIRILLEKAKSDGQLIEEMKSVITKLNQLTFDVLQQRCSKHRAMVQKLNGADLPSILPAQPQQSVSDKDKGLEPIASSNSNGSETTTIVNETKEDKPKSPNPYSVRGGGYKNKNKSPPNGRMCLSSLPNPEVRQSPQNKNENQDMQRMSKSVNSDLRKSLSDQTPLLNSLLRESQILKTQTEEKIQSLSGSLEEIKEIKKERDSIKWDFLEQ